jgi:hypothetical protein
MRQLFKRITFKRISGFYLVMLICIPLLFINVRNSHDWGCDFAQYIHQAKNLIEGIPQSETGYIYNNDTPFVGPKAYTMGFPILLSPVYYFFGNDIKAFSYLISFFLYLLAICLFFFYNKYFSVLTSILMTLIICFNPTLIDFKASILSEIPFTLVLFGLILLYKKFENRQSFLISITLGLLCGLLLSIRQIGIVFIAAVGVESLLGFYSAYKNKSFPLFLKYQFTHKVILCITALIFYFLLNNVIFHIPSSGFALYLSTISPSIIGNNFSFYFKIINDLFSHSFPYLQFMARFTGAFVLVFIAIGMIKKFTSGFDLTDAITLIYLITILWYPYQSDGFRILLPLIPFLMYYLVIALKELRKTFWYLNRKWVLLMLGLFILFQYSTGISNILYHQKDIIYGPQERDAIMAFSYIKMNVPKDAIIDFPKPRAISLYTDRKCFAHSNEYTLPEMRLKFEAVGVSYILYNEPFEGYVPDSVLIDYIEANKDKVLLLWNNNKYRIYKIK